MHKQREHWGTRLGFILAAAGSAIGLGTLWKFPYITGQNGGGLFVLIYILCICTISIPVLVAELILGRKAQRGAVGVFVALANDSTSWKAVGWLGVAASFLIMSFYSVVGGWGLNYVLMSLNQFYVGRSPEAIHDVFNVLAASGDVTLFWHFAFTGLTVAVVYPGVRQGIEYWGRFMMSSLFILLVGLFLYSTTLEGFGEAVRFLLYPDFAEFKASSALQALGLALLTLSLGQGIMLTYGSYMRQQEDIPRTAGILGGMIVFTSLLAGLTIFPIVFTFGLDPQGGAGLVFKTLPVLFSQLPGALLISTAFFALFVFTGLTSAVALVEVVVANFMDLLGWSRKRSVIVVGLGTFIFGIPSALSGATNSLFASWPQLYGKTFFSTIDDLVSIWFLPIGALMVAIFVGWTLDKKIAKEEFCAGSKFKWLWRVWCFFIRWVAPIAIITIILQESGIIDVDKFFHTP